MVLWKRDLDHLKHLGGGADASGRWEVRAEGAVLWTPAREGQGWVVAVSGSDFLGSQRVQVTWLGRPCVPCSHLLPLHTRSQAHFWRQEARARMTLKF